MKVYEHISVGLIFLCMQYSRGGGKYELTMDIHYEDGYNDKNLSLNDYRKMYDFMHYWKL